MKKMNLLVMSLVSAAALSFTSCSSNDDLAGDNASQEKVDGFYMTLSIQTPKANGTRTSQEERTTKEATADEAKITTGTFYLYDGDKCIFKKQITEADWQQKTSDKQNTGITNAIKVSVNGVAENHPYHVYFLAGEKTSNTPIVDEFTGTYTIDEKNPTSISLDLAKAGSFVMFNQNDAQRNFGGDQATVTFTSANKTATNPAKCENIYLDRIVARIDAPSAADATNITVGTGENAPATENIADWVKGIAYQNYAVSNLNTQTNVMQKWENEYAKFLAPVGTYTLDYDTYGDKFNNNGSLGNFGKAASSYVLENTTDNLKKATAVYLCYKANLKTTADKDFKDGTFYRYDGKIYTSLQQIFDDSSVEYPFVNATTDAKVAPAEAVKEIKNEDGTLKDQATLAAFRQKYNIDVYEQGLMYYRVALDDQSYKFESTGLYSILRNSIYKMNVNAVYDLGRDVPNGPTPDDKKPNYYMQCTVTVNQWVVSEQPVELK